MTNRPSGLPPLNVRIADRLLAERKIKVEAYQAVLAQMKRPGRRVEDALLDVGAISEAELLKYLAALYKTRFVSTEKLSRADIDRTTLEKIPRKMAERYEIVPVVFDAVANTLSFVTADPENVEVLDQVRKGAGVREVRALVARPAAIKAAFSKFYGQDSLAFAQLEKKGPQDLHLLGRTLSENSMAAITYDTGRERVLSAEDLSMPGSVAPKPPRGAPSSRSAGPGAVSTSTAAPITAPEPITVSDAYLDTLKVMVSLLENGRADLRGHSSQVARLARRLGERGGLVKQDLNALIVAAYLHDLGKMGAYHLTALNVSEYDGHRIAAQKSHPTPLRLMEAVTLHAGTLAALEGMYERFDGMGMPARKAGKDIPLGARLLSIVDTYADLTQNPRNPFRKALKPVEACQALEKYKGSIFDPHLLDLFRATVAGDDLRARILSNRYVALLVDADPEETTVLELRMIEDGIEVRIARTSDQALELLKTGEIEIVISEIDLAPRDGFALLAEARAQPWGRDVPWLVLTRQKGRAEAQRAFEFGVIDYVLKPAAPEVLVAKLRQALEKRATAAPAHGVSGSLAEMALPDLIQLLWHGRKTGRLKIRRGTDSGEIHFLEGMVVNAMWGKLRGEEAVYATIGMTEGEFALEPQFKPQHITISVSPEALLLEGMRRMDEGERSL